MSGPSKIVQFSLEQGGAMVALDSNGNLWRGEIDRGYYVPHSALAYYGQSVGTLQTALENAANQANMAQAQYTAGTGKVKWVRISE